MFSGAMKRFNLELVERDEDLEILKLAKPREMRGDPRGQRPGLNWTRAFLLLWCVQNFDVPDDL